MKPTSIYARWLRLLGKGGCGTNHHECGTEYEVRMLVQVCSQAPCSSIKPRLLASPQVSRQTSSFFYTIRAQISVQSVTNMVPVQRVLQICLLLAVAGTASGSETIIQWGTCIEDFDSPLPVDCGRLFVPLDYTNSTSDVTLSLELLRVPAAIQPARGSILLNFGGPGAPGRENLPPFGPLLQA